MIELRGERVTLRPFRREEFDLVWEHRVREAAPRELTRGQKQRLRNRYARSGEMHNGFLDLAIEAQGRLIGDCDLRRPPRGLPAGVYELGIGLFDTADRGKGYGREAIRLLADYAFRELGAHRVQGSTAVDNLAMRRVFEREGFTFEGVMRAFMPRPDGDGRDDYALYAMTRADRHEQES
jgi:RimJ/RimL family protein N-acetyltransferase